MDNTELADHTIELKNLKISNKYPLTLISGPCQLESLEHAMMIAEKLIQICDRNDINFVLQGKRYFSFWLFLVSQSYDQNTKQDTLPCVRVRSQMKD